jgi:hypothetical protein
LGVIWEVAGHPTAADAGVTKLLPENHSISTAKNMLLSLHPINYKIQMKPLIPLTNFDKPRCKIKP